MRIFADEQGRMNRSVMGYRGDVLLVSQFTLLGDLRKGRRPAFDGAEAPEKANDVVRSAHRTPAQDRVACRDRRFRADMQVDLLNDGPVTTLLDSRRTF